MIHHISYRVFVYGTEDEEKVREAIKTIFPTSSPQMEMTEGYHKNPILVLHDRITKKKDLNAFIKILKEMKDPNKKNILNRLKSKMDDKGNLFIRFDKQEAYLGNLKVVEHGDAIRLKIKMAAYPAKKEIAMKLARKLLGGEDVF